MEDELMDVAAKLPGRSVYNKKAKPSAVQCVASLLGHGVYSGMKCPRSTSLVDSTAQCRIAITCRAEGNVFRGLMLGSADLTSLGDRRRMKRDNLLRQRQPQGFLTGWKFPQRGELRNEPFLQRQLPPGFLERDSWLLPGQIMDAETSSLWPKGWTSSTRRIADSELTTLFVAGLTCTDGKQGSGQRGVQGDSSSQAWLFELSTHTHVGGGGWCGSACS
ncbi:hypothetical protein J3459_004008 [Metarhizium acridum]|nr:hypothetical protein J3459_004008 [Metarhizium acridum]